MVDLCIGIDWSGARGEFHKGIQVAEARPGDQAPVIITPPHPRGWSRQAVLDHLMARAGEGQVLAGIDFAFAHPFGDEGYYPGVSDAPQSPEALWSMIEAANAEQDHLYGGGIWHDPHLGPFYNAPIKDGRGVKFASRRRLTEIASAEINGRHPSPTFNCVGPAGVGTGSLAGMRLLHRLAGTAAIWPIIPAPEASLTVVEIFPSLYFSMAGVTDKAKKAAPLKALNDGLHWWGSAPVSRIAERLPDNDDLDALISAAALRCVSRQGLPEIAPADRPAASREGWIFGVGWAKEGP
ncbi:MAG: hypothetical protein ACON4P_00770 [Candidatus Puniceispirillales bacterium]